MLQNNEKTKEQQGKYTDRRTLYKTRTEIPDRDLVPAGRKLHADKSVLDLALLHLHAVHVNIPSVFKGNRDEEQSVLRNLCGPVDPVIPDLIFQCDLR